MDQIQNNHLLVELGKHQSTMDTELFNTLFNFNNYFAGNRHMIGQDPSFSGHYTNFFGPPYSLMSCGLEWLYV